MMNTNTADKLEKLTNWQPIAAYLNLKERAFWDLVHTRMMPHYRFNSRVYRFRLSEVIRWAESHLQRGSSE